MNTTTPEIHRLASEYLLPPLQTEFHSFHRAALMPQPRIGSLQLALDPNFCGLDDFGEPRGCTRMMIMSFEVQLERLREEQGQTLFAVVSKEDLPARFRLVVIDAPQLAECPARLLMLDDDDRITQIVHLHPTERPRKG